MATNTLRNLVDQLRETVAGVAADPEPAVKLWYLSGVRRLTLSND